MAGPSRQSIRRHFSLPTESDKLTRCLFGEYYSHAASILDLSGRAAIYFVFSDLSVKLEGLFRPRYRFFDLFSRCDWSEDVPVLAECWGGVFAVYSTKEFPGLKASSELTKHLNRWGIRVNIRETERKRRATGGGSNAGGGAGARRGSEEDDDDATVMGVGGGAPSGSASASGSGQMMDMDAPRRFLEGTAQAPAPAREGGEAGREGQEGRVEEGKARRRGPRISHLGQRGRRRCRRCKGTRALRARQAGAGGASAEVRAISSLYFFLGRNFARRFR